MRTLRVHTTYQEVFHLALLLLPGVDLPARAYIEKLRDAYGKIRAADIV